MVQLKSDKKKARICTNEKNSPRESFGPDIPWTSRVPGWCGHPGSKTSGRPRNLRKTSIWVRTSMTRTRGRPWPRGVREKKLREERLRADCSFPKYGWFLYLTAYLVAPYRVILRYYRCDTPYRAILSKGGKRSPKMVRYPPLYLISHRHICAIPHFATYRAVIVRYPTKTSTK